MSEQTNAIIESTQLGICDHGILTAWVNLKFDSSGQGFGGFALDSNPGELRPESKRRPSAACGLFIARVCEVIGVDYWENLKGKPCRVIRDDNRVQAIGNFIKDDWFYPEREFKRLEVET